MQKFIRLGIAPAVALCASLFASSVQAKQKPPVGCKTPPWATFAGSPADRPYRPLVTLQEDSRIGGNPPFSAGRLNVDLKLEETVKDDAPVTMIGETPVIGVPTTRMLPGARTSGYYFEPDGSLCTLTREQMDSPEFHKTF